MNGNPLTDKHNLLKNSAPRSGINSLIHPDNGSYIFQYLKASGTAIIQSGRPSGLYANIPGISAQIIPPGSMTATGYSSDFVLALAGTPQEHIMAYPAERIAELFDDYSWIPAR